MMMRDWRILMKVLVTSSRTKKRWRCKLDCSVYPQNAGDHLIIIISISYVSIHCHACTYFNYTLLSGPL